MPSRRIAGFLWVLAEVKYPAHHLYVPLVLHMSTHHAKAQGGLATPGNKAWDDRMERPLAWAYTIGMRGIQGKGRAPILHRDPCPGNDDPRPKRLKVGLNERNHHAIGICRREIYRVLTYGKCNRR